MIHSVILFLSVVLCTAMAAVVNLPLNPQAHLSREVESVQHHVHIREIIIQLKPSRRCQRPTFWIRISGTSLFVLHLKKVETNKLVYTYPDLADEGIYFVEVTALLCAPFKPDAFVDMCLEEPAESNNIVTLPYSFKVTGNEAKKAPAQPRPRWVVANQSVASLMPTRYQKLGCPAFDDGWCPTRAVDLEQYDLYEWVDGPNYIKPLQDVLSLTHNARNQQNHSNIRVCMVGDSHARDLTIAGNKLNIDRVEFFLLLTRYPHEFDVNWLRNGRCSYTVVTYGQWPASWLTFGNPYNQTKYTNDMRRVITLLQNFDHNQTQVFVRSVNYTPLMAHQTQCPPTDFRYPPLIDMYNDVLRRLCKELSVDYVDLSHIMGPVWDSAEDWYHPSLKVYTAEIKWILHRILTTSLHHQRPVVLFPNEISSVGATVIRYSDNATVYLLRDGVIRAFPSAQTLYTMGYNFEMVKILHPSARKDSTLGPELPYL